MFFLNPTVFFVYRINFDTDLQFNDGDVNDETCTAVPQMMTPPMILPSTTSTTTTTTASTVTTPTRKPNGDKPPIYGLSNQGSGYFDAYSARMFTFNEVQYDS